MIAGLQRKCNDHNHNLKSSYDIWEIKKNSYFVLVIIFVSGVPYDMHCKAVLFLASCGFEGKNGIIDWFYFLKNLPKKMFLRDL